MSKRRTHSLPAVLLLLAVALAGCAGRSGTSVESVPVDPADLAAAEAEYRAALAADPRDAEAHRGLGGVLARRGKPGLAADEFDRAVMLDAGLVDDVARDRLAAMAFYQGQARTLLDESRVNEASGALDAADLMHRPDAESLRLRARISSLAGRYDGALAFLREAERLDPGDDRIEEDLRTALVRVAETRADAGDYQRALDAVTEARKRDDRIELVYMEGSIAYAWAQHAPPSLRGEPLERAAAAFREVRRIRPNDLDAAYNLGAVLLSGEDYDGAVTLYRELLGENPRDGDLYLALALAHGHLGKTELAEAEKAAGHALRSGEPVEDVAMWVERAAQRYPGSELQEGLQAEGEPDAVHTFNRPGGDLVEVWFWWGKGLVRAFQDGRGVGDPVRVPAS